MTRSPSEIVNSSGSTGVKTCLTLRLSPSSVLPANDATEDRTEIEDGRELKNE